MSDINRIVLGYEPWGDEIIPECVFLAQAGGCDEYFEDAVSMEMARAVWELIASKKVNFTVKWGKSCYFSPNESYYIEVANFVFKIFPQDTHAFRAQNVFVEPNRKEIFEALVELNRSPHFKALR